MYLAMMTRLAVVLAAASTAASMGMPVTAVRRDLRLSAEMGVNPDIMLSLKKSANALAEEGIVHTIDAQYAEVSLCSILNF